VAVDRWHRIARSAGRALDDRRIADAIRLYGKAAEEADIAGETVMLAVILHNLGLALDQQGDGERARDAVLRARDLLSSAEANEGGAEYLGAVLRTLGGLDVELGDLEAGIACQREAIRHAEAQSDLDGATGAQVDLGIALKDAGRLSEARDQLTAALEQARQRGLDKVTAHALTALGLTEEKLHLPGPAQAHYREALPLYRKLSDPGNQATVLYNLASLLDASGEWDQAAGRLDEALALYRDAADSRGAADCRAALASIEIARGNPARARKLHEAAVEFFRAGGYRRRAIDSLVDLAAIARDEGRFEEGRRLLAEAGELAAELADPLVIHDVELHRGDLCFKSGDEPGARAHYARAADVMQQSRELLTREEESLSFFGPDRLEDIDRLITLTGDDPRACVEWIERAKGQELLRRLDGAAVPHAPSWADMQHLLERIAADDPARGVVLVHYYVRDTVTAVVGVMRGRTPESVPVAMEIGDLRRAAADPAHPSWWRTETLLAPLVAPISAWAAPGDLVMICPHDALHHFPLHVIDVDGQPLGQRNIVSYLPSAGVLRHCLASRGTAGSDVVILADATSTRPLPLAHDQALALGGLLAAHQRSVRCYTGDAATLRALEGNLGDGRAPGLAHFAVHGFTDPSTGLDSGLRLADGPLTARRLVGLRLGGALVCLGACETGISERLAGDELLGLVRSALYAGAGSVVASLWPVDQLSSSMLMLDFHQGVLDGVGKAAALHAAQLRLCAATVTDVLAHLAMAR
jgi:tetratricopeptide (TPR) repeat protein